MTSVARWSRGVRARRALERARGSARRSSRGASCRRTASEPDWRGRWRCGATTRPAATRSTSASPASIGSREESRTRQAGGCASSRPRRATRLSPRSLPKRREVNAAEDHLRDSRLAEGADGLLDLGRRRAPLASPERRHDAERAAPLAAVLDLQEGARPSRARGARERRSRRTSSGAERRRRDLPGEESRGRLVEEARRARRRPRCPATTSTSGRRASAVRVALGETARHGDERARGAPVGAAGGGEARRGRRASVTVQAWRTTASTGSPGRRAARAPTPRARGRGRPASTWLTLHPRTWTAYAPNERPGERFAPVNVVDRPTSGAIIGDFPEETSECGGDRATGPTTYGEDDSPDRIRAEIPRPHQGLSRREGLRARGRQGRRGRSRGLQARPA